MNHYVHNQNYAQGITLSSFTQRALTQGGGPVPTLGSGPEYQVSEGDYASINLGNSQQKLLAIPLLTCAAVVLVSTDPNAPARAAVLHAASGTIPNGMMATLNGLLGNPPPASLLAAYVTPKPWDYNYDNDALKIQAFGVPANQITYMDWLPATQFGINARGQIGF